MDPIEVIKWAVAMFVAVLCLAFSGIAIALLVKFIKEES
jgi:hypothetical protein